MDACFLFLASFLPKCWKVFVMVEGQAGSRDRQAEQGRQAGRAQQAGSWAFCFLLQNAHKPNHIVSSYRYVFFPSFLLLLLLLFFLCIL